MTTYPGQTSVELKCYLLTIPNLETRWEKDGRELLSSGRIKTFDSRGVRGLTIKNPTQEDAGTYSVRITGCDGVNLYSAARVTIYSEFVFQIYSYRSEISLFIECFPILFRSQQHNVRPRHLFFLSLQQRLLRHVLLAHLPLRIQLFLSFLSPTHTFHHLEYAPNPRLDQQCRPEQKRQSLVHVGHRRRLLRL